MYVLSVSEFEMRWAATDTHTAAKRGSEEGILVFLISGT
jgi:hypothetical protein